MSGQANTGLDHFSPTSSFLDDALFAAFEYDPLPEARAPVAGSGVSFQYPTKPSSIINHVNVSTSSGSDNSMTMVSNNNIYIYYKC